MQFFPPLGEAVWISPDLRLGLIIAAVLGAGFLGLILLLFVTARVERTHIRRFVPLPPERLGKLNSKLTGAAEGLSGAGLELLGHFSDGDAGMKEGFASLLLSPQDDVLVQIVHRRPKRTRVISRLAGGQWVTTADITGVVDLTGTRDEAMLPRSPAAVLLRYHRQRLADRGEAVIPFDRTSLLDDLVRAERERVGLLVRNGLARFLNEEHSVYRYTFRGSFALTSRFLRILSRIDAARKQADARKLAWQRYHANDERDSTN